MGCTTSASNVHTPDANATGKHIKFTEELKERSDVEQIIPKDQDEYQDVKVLPKCDTLVESIPLSKITSNEKYFIDMSTIDIERVCQSNENEITKLDNLTDDKITSLEKVVEKVIETKSIDSSEKIAHCNLNNEPDAPIVKSHDNNCENSFNTGNQNNKISEGKIDQPDAEKKTHEHKEEYSEEATSPSQSESSRATRWEALADIAAELPPSLAVDPITGQIYSLAK